MRFRNLFHRAGIALFARLGKTIEIETCEIRPVIDITNAAILDLKPVALTVVVVATGVAQRLVDGNLFVQAAAFVSGPKADGVTQNAAILFIGGDSVTVELGFPLAPGVAGTPIGANVPVGPCNLSDFRVIGTIGDVLRVLYFA